MNVRDEGDPRKKKVMKGNIRRNELRLSKGRARKRLEKRQRRVGRASGERESGIAKKGKNR